MKKTLSLLGLFLVSIAAMAQTTFDEVAANLNKAGGVYYAYPVSTSENTAAPKGYEPFYISHYGRHGSRYLIGDNDYEWVLKFMKEANDAGVLTPLGKDVVSRLEKLMVVVKGHGGDLSPLGVRQHKGIAARMIAAYPQVFKGEAKVTARSTTSMRCAMSMSAFCEALKEVNPKLQVSREASNRNMWYLNYHSEESNAWTGAKDTWRIEYNKFEAAHTNPDRMMKALFADENYVLKKVVPHDLMWGFYWIAIDMQDIDVNDISFFDLFTAQELFDLWQSFSYRFYVCDGSYAGNHRLPVLNARNLLRNIIESADAAIAGTGDAATLRFGHDGNLIPLAAILRLKDCYNAESNPADFYKAFADFKISPMAGNIQIVFFRNKKNPQDVICKFMLNERETSIPVDTDIAPFYHWNDVKKYYQTTWEL